MPGQAGHAGTRELAVVETVQLPVNRDLTEYVVLQARGQVLRVACKQVDAQSGRARRARRMVDIDNWDRDLASEPRQVRRRNEHAHEGVGTSLRVGSAATDGLVHRVSLPQRVAA